MTKTDRTPQQIHDEFIAELKDQIGLTEAESKPQAFIPKPKTLHSSRIKTYLCMNCWAENQIDPIAFANGNIKHHRCVKCGRNKGFAKPESAADAFLIAKSKKNSARQTTRKRNRHFHNQPRTRCTSERGCRK